MPVSFPGPPDASCRFRDRDIPNANILHDHLLFGGWVKARQGVRRVAFLFLANAFGIVCRTFEHGGGDGEYWRAQELWVN